MKKFRYSIFIRFISTYILVLIVPTILIGSYVYRNFTGVLEKQVEKSIDRMEQQIADMMDTRVKELENIYNSISNDPEVLELFTDRFQKEKSYQYLLGLRKLKTYMTANALIDNVYIRYNDTILDINGLPLSQYYHGINKVFTMNYKMNGLFYNKDAMKNSVLFIKSLPSDVDRPMGYFIFTIPKDSFTRIINGILGEYEGSVYMMNVFGEVIASNRENSSIYAERQLKSILEDSKKKGSITQYIDGKKYIISGINSRDTGLTYLTVIPHQEIMDRVEYIKSGTAQIIGFALILGLILAYSFSYGNYRPIKKMVSTIILNDPSRQRVVYKNELELINNEYSNTLNENLNLRIKVREHMTASKSDFLLKLLRGQVTCKDTAKQTANTLNIQIEDGPFIAVLLSMDNYYLNDNALKIVDDIDRLNALVYSYLDSIFEKSGKFNIIFPEEDKIAIIIRSEDGELMLENMEEYLKKLLMLLSEKLEFTLTIGVGNPYDNLFSIKDSYREARMAVEYKMVKGRNNVIFYNAIDDKGYRLDLKCFYLMREKNNILNYLNAGDINGVRQELDSLFKSIMKPGYSLEQIKYMRHEIINDTVRIASSFNIESSRLLDLIYTETLDELRNSILFIYTSIWGSVTRLRQKRNTDIGEQLLKYVHEHYRDPGLSLEQLSAEFNLSAPYLSKIFKEKVGINFINYLIETRINAAKLVLLNDKRAVKDIAQNVGYTEVHTFIRNFKEYEDLTPGQYRKKFNIS